MKSRRGGPPSRRDARAAGSRPPLPGESGCDAANDRGMNSLRGRFGPSLLIVVFVGCAFASADSGEPSAPVPSLQARVVGVGIPGSWAVGAAGAFRPRRIGRDDTTLAATAAAAEDTLDASRLPFLERWSQQRQSDPAARGVVATALLRRAVGGGGGALYA